MHAHTQALLVLLYPKFAPVLSLAADLIQIDSLSLSLSAYMYPFSSLL